MPWATGVPSFVMRVNTPPVLVNRLPCWSHFLRAIRLLQLLGIYRTSSSWRIYLWPLHHNIGFHYQVSYPCHCCGSPWMEVGESLMLVMDVWGCCTVSKPVIKDKSCIIFFWICYIRIIKIKHLSFFRGVKRHSWWFGFMNGKHNVFIIMDVLHFVPSFYFQSYRR